MRVRLAGYWWLVEGLYEPPLASAGIPRRWLILADGFSTSSEALEFAGRFVAKPEVYQWESGQ